MVYCIKDNNVKIVLDGYLLNYFSSDMCGKERHPNCMDYTVTFSIRLESRRLKVSRKTFVSLIIQFTIILANGVSSCGMITKDLYKGTEMDEWAYNRLMNDLTLDQRQICNGVVFTPSCGTDEKHNMNKEITFEFLSYGFKINGDIIMSVPSVFVPQQALPKGLIKENGQIRTPRDYLDEQVDIRFY